MNIISLIFNWLKDSNHQKFVLITTLVIALFLLVNQCSVNKAIKDKDAQNTAALLDTVRVMKNKMDQFFSTKLVTIGDLDELKKFNKDLYDDVKKMKGDVATISKISGTIVYVDRPIYSQIVKYADGTAGIIWSDTTATKDYYREIIGESKFKVDTTTGQILDKKTTLLKDFTRVDIHTGIWKNPATSKWEIFANNDNPKMSFKLDGHIVDDQIAKLSATVAPAKWHFGFYGGVGGQIPRTYDDGHTGWFSITGGFQVGIGLQYSIFNF